jgi:hypothetical protein
MGTRTLTQTHTEKICLLQRQSIAFVQSMSTVFEAYELECTENLALILTNIISIFIIGKAEVASFQLKQSFPQLTVQLIPSCTLVIYVYFEITVSLTMHH